VIAFLNDTGLKPKRTSVGAPWQNGIAERWVGSARREILDHIIALSESHLRRLIREYVSYHHEDRIHDSLDKDTPNRRAIELRPSAAHEVIGMSRLGEPSPQVRLAPSGLSMSPRVLSDYVPSRHRVGFERDAPMGSGSVRPGPNEPH
jgi:Integrase core domain